MLLYQSCTVRTYLLVSEVDDVFGPARFLGRLLQVQKERAVMDGPAFILRPVNVRFMLKTKSRTEIKLSDSKLTNWQQITPKEARKYDKQVLEGV